MKYCISFNTKEIPGRIEAVQVHLKKLYMREQDKVRVDLCNDPLYPALVQYVKNNPGPVKVDK